MIDQGDAVTEIKNESALFAYDMESGSPGSFSETGMKNGKASVTNRVGGHKLLSCNTTEDIGYKFGEG